MSKQSPGSDAGEFTARGVTRPVVETRGITKSFAGVPVLRAVDLRIMPGEILGLVGENGAGKSTLMNIIAGKHAPSSGSIAFNGTPVTVTTIAQGQAHGVRFVHQELSAIGALSVAENVFLGHYLTKRSSFIDYAQLNENAGRILARVGLEHVAPSASMGSLSSGEQQLVELAKAVARQPRLLILDEPTSSLTATESRKVFELMHELAEQGAGLIFVSHRLEDAIAHCDRIAVLRDGRLVADLAAGSTNKEQLIVHMVGKPATFVRRSSGVETGPARLVVHDIAATSAPAGVSFSVRGGEIVGLYGLVGSGRTEFLEALYGYRKARSGNVLVDGRPLKLGRVSTAVRDGVFMLPEGRKLRGILPKHSVRSNISISALAGFSRAGFVKEKVENSECERLAHSLNIQMADIRQPITFLSGGNQQKALFARAMLARPKVLLLDEPTHGVDVGAKSEIYDIISKLAAGGTAVLVASSELPEILAIADRCLVFAGGHVVADLDRGQMSEEVILSHAFTLGKAHASAVASGAIHRG